MDRAIAQQVSELMLEYASKLDDSVALVMSSCGEEEARAYRSAVGKIMGEILLEILNPLYDEHPDLKPPQLS